ncbi:MAG: CoA ester lyase [Cycloclasticus sp.]|nr:CoA ester lyase [Cycloclasticus sp.]MBQ0789334.1 CoA ester lyase [Cycloclasticus sp.]
MTTPRSLYRSLLFVPGSAQKRIDKSASIAADGLIFDLEDAVSPDAKASARDTVVAALGSAAFAGKQIIVRVNGITSPWFNDDMQAIVAAGHCDIMLPKCESANDVAAVKKLTTGKSIKLHVIIETAKGVLALHEISNGLSASDSLCFGHVDFATDMALPAADASQGVVYHARCQVALAAHAFGVTPIDNVCLEVADDAIIRADATAGINLGYAGKLCIHPNQVPIVNDVYTPSAEQVQLAKEILAAWEDVQKQGQGVFSFKNKMIDLPVIQAQESILRRYAAATEENKA